MNDAWDLSAPESLVLRDGPKAKPADVIKVALLELVTRRVLRLVEVETRDRLGRPKSEIVIGAGSSSTPVEGPLALVANVALESKATTYPDGTVGLRIADFARAFAAKHTNAPQLFVPRTVLPALEARGLYTSTRRKWLRIIPWTDWTRTPKGDRALERLTELTTTAEREVAGWSERDPRRLATFLAVAGGAALLVPTAYPVFEDFARRVRTQPDDGGAAASVAVLPAATDEDGAPGDLPADAPGDLPAGPSPDLPAGPTPELHGGLNGSGFDAPGFDAPGFDAPGFDVSALDFSALSVDLSGIGGLDGALASVDAGIAAGVSSGDGGGGGGGDGGGSS